MASSKDITMARPASSHRLSVSSGTSGSAVARLTHSRPHTHSLSVGSINPAHRVTRRKSTSSTAANSAAAMAAAMREASGTPFDVSNGSVKRPTSSKTAAAKFGHPSFPSSLPTNDSDFAHNGYRDVKNNVAVTDGPPLSSLPEKEKGNGKPRVRRASEGSRLIKGESKRGNAPELRCEKCGKGYKHSSCLTKHLWEHTPEWAITSKLLISKHQQVQLLEAASVLVTMNQDGPAVESDHSTASPAASGSSDPHEDGMSSADTTPPPDLNAPYSASRPDSGKRLSSNSSAYSQSYSSIFSDSGSAGRPYVSHYRQWSTDGRPTTSGTSVTGSYRDDEDQADLAAAVGLLSCSYGTPKSGPIMLPADVPPVPPLPAKYTGQKPDTLSGSTTTLTPHYRSATGRNFSLSDNKDVDMDDRSMADEDAEHYHRMRNYEEEEGVFGKMEE